MKTNVGVPSPPQPTKDETNALSTSGCDGRHLLLYRQSGLAENGIIGGSRRHIAGLIQKVKTTHPFRIDAMVVLLDHLHAMWTPPADDRDYPTRLMLIKSGFSHRTPNGERRNLSRHVKAERGI